MKLDARRLPEFLRDPGACRVVLMHGEDVGLIRERAGALVRAVAGSLDDPFRVVELDRDQLSTLRDAAMSLSLTGGRCVVRVREAAESAADGVKAILSGPSAALVVLEALSLPPRSKLRALIEGSAEAAAIACYPEEGKSLTDTIRSVLGGLGARVDPDARDWLAGQLGADRALTRQELEKLALYAGAGGTIDLPAAMACVGDLAGLSLDDALFAATEGDVAMTDRALELAIAEGAAPVSILRSALFHLQRLHRARLEAEAGMGTQEAARSARPPVFFRRMPAFLRALDTWSSTALARAIASVTEAEAACKRTGAPDLAICRGAILTLGRRAAAARATARHAR